MLEWIPHNLTTSDTMVQPTSFVFHHLKTIKINRFFGTSKQILMVKFLLEKAVTLETMVLVIPVAKSKVAQLRLLHEQLLLLSKGSTDARFVLKNLTEDDDSVLLTHYRYRSSLLSWHC
ncbi:hypothetical protein MRB53_014231 [Persea americana]|uniref:Uncharacterized protein n=1 Tax=Persea americana TaxID=3435 RepID=A0ACC2KAB0_PERAE|nr:hypothetical protein MRB53_014231 [Persea americana]